jgi:hypothetical protein
MQQYFSVGNLITLKKLKKKKKKTKIVFGRGKTKNTTDEKARDVV